MKLSWRYRDACVFAKINGGMRDGTHRKDLQKRPENVIQQDLFVVLVDKGSFVSVHGDDLFPLE